VGKARQRVEVGDPLDVGGRSIGANSPLRPRLLVITWVTVRAISTSPGVPAMKSGMAIGIGCTLPRVTSSCSTARAGFVRRPASATATPPAIITFRLLIASNVESFRCRINRFPETWCPPAAALEPEHFLRIELNFDLPPCLVLGRRQEAVRCALVDGADRSLGGHLEEWNRFPIDHHGLGTERAVTLELNAHDDHKIAR